MTTATPATDLDDSDVNDDPGRDAAVKIIAGAQALAVEDDNDALDDND